LDFACAFPSSPNEFGNAPNLSGVGGGEPNVAPPYTSSNEAEQPHQSFEDQAAAWRQYQQERQRNQTPEQAASATDEDGRMKLLASVSRTSLSFWFFVLVWRSVHHYELADKCWKGNTRLALVIPPVALFIGNLAGCVSSLTGPKNVTKKRLKAILNLDKLVEAVLLVYNVLRLTVYPSKYTPREIYVGRLFHNFLYIISCQMFTKVTWDAAQQIRPQTTMYGGTPGYEYQEQPRYDQGQPNGQESGYEGNTWN